MAIGTTTTHPSATVTIPVIDLALWSACGSPCREWRQCLEMDTRRYYPGASGCGSSTTVTPQPLDGVVFRGPSELSRLSVLVASPFS